MPLYQFFAKGGIMMIPLILCSFLAVVILVERLIALRKIRINSRTFVLQVKNLLLRNRIDEAIALSKQTPGPIAAITKAGLVKHTKPREEIKDSIESAARTQIFHLEKNLGILGTVAAIAPLIGFLGTVTGMIKAFMEIQLRGGNVDAGVLAGGIWEALITTAFGLSIGIPALIFYNWLLGKVEFHVQEMRESSGELLDMLLEKEDQDEHRSLT
ncbi:MAG TPA: MotA/TolQ/ExbB proton channel family protein [bacterium]|nr:MotA/TolQ/ExbB proton channel family protein [bacterium]HNT64579.1 MotA/TolQ/ExbB proton channel family protein [bacterium]HOX84578.1 MotA/TolQ/ExbB proton channel family protein [bacterium]HPG45301.1 MotA/TolQ/ExbB proton channel family protein [bacterium]HPM98980.1 MotA/TolQ/ExbB proton channel family protein [bacterium]